MAGLDARPLVGGYKSYRHKVLHGFGDEVTIVGYGYNKNFVKDGAMAGSGNDAKRTGTNHVSSLEDGMIVLSGLTGMETGKTPGADAASGAGDSGGPLYVNGRLAGITSGAGLKKRPDGTIVTTSFYVNLNGDAQKAFLASALAK